MWDFQFDDEQQACIDKLFHNTVSNSTLEHTENNDDSSVLKSQTDTTSSSVSTSGVYHAVLDAEKSCSILLKEIDSSLMDLDSLSSHYSEVVGRSNDLMMTCEHLLEQQHSMNVTVNVLKETLYPFDEMDKMAYLLGIPVDARGKRLEPRQNVSSSSMSLDPRSPEFKVTVQGIIDMENQLFAKHKASSSSSSSYHDTPLYVSWLLEHVYPRATSLVSRTMRELLDCSAGLCKEALHRQLIVNRAKAKANQKVNSSKDNLPMENGASASTTITNTVNGATGELPLEASPIYQKFRSLGFRMRELSAMLDLIENHIADNTHEHMHHSHSGGSEARTNGKSSPRNVPSKDSLVSQAWNKWYTPAANGPPANHYFQLASSTSGSSAGAASPLADIKQHFTVLRVELLLPLMLQQEESMQLPAAASPSTEIDTAQRLCTAIRHAYSMLFRIAVLEEQLCNTLFGASEVGVTASTAPPSTSGTSATAEVLQSILQALCSATEDYLRPRIIAENSVEELCRVVTILRHDIRSLITSAFHSSNAGPAAVTSGKGTPKRHNNVVQEVLLIGLDRTISNAQERLFFCAELLLRHDIQMFEPTTDQLDYPMIIVPSASDKNDVADGTTMLNVSNSSFDAMVATWYPPMKSTLSLLSKIYGTIEYSVFSDFAQRCLVCLLKGLRAGSDMIRKGSSALTANQSATNLYPSSTTDLDTVTLSNFHAELFLIRHSLILREQLAPFQLQQCQQTIRELDFTSTGRAVSQLLLSLPSTGAANDANVVQATTSVWQWNVNNGLLHFAANGTPNITETNLSIQEEMDQLLKNSCLALKSAIVKLAFGPICAFLTKIEAFSGIELKTDAAGTRGTHATLAKETVAQLMNQSFLSHDRLCAMLSQHEKFLKMITPVVKANIQLYLTNGTARSILLKPILSEVDMLKRKMIMVLLSDCCQNVKSADGKEVRLDSLVSSLLTGFSKELASN